MNEIQLIKRIIGEAIAPYGFEDEGSEKKRGVIFIRKREKLKQYICVQLVARNHLRLEFRTNAYQQRNISVNELLPRKRPANWSISIPGMPLPDDWWEWKDESEFTAILIKFTDIIMKYGFQALEEISIPASEIHPAIQSDWKLYRNHAAFNAKYRKILGIQKDTSNTEIWNIINKAVLEAGNRDFKEIEELLMGLAAVYGEMIIMKYGGEWKWRDDFNNICWISALNGRKYYPLHELTDYWAAGKDDGEYPLDREDILK